MFSKSELLDAIEELEMSPATYQNAEKLATFYSLYDHLYMKPEPINRVETIDEVIIGEYGDSEFMRMLSGKRSKDVWPIIDELMDAIHVLQPKLYDAVLDKLS